MTNRRISIIEREKFKSDTNSLIGYLTARSKYGLDRPTFQDIKEKLGMSFSRIEDICESYQGKGTLAVIAPVPLWMSPRRRDHTVSYEFSRIPA